MQIFLVELNFLKPFASFGDVVPQHRAFLQTGYDSGLLLMSGPREDKTGGIVVARAPDLPTLQSFFELDPYKLNGLAEHRFVSFTAAKRSPLVEDWISGTDCAKMTA
jgi:uncharacterized protein YciI